MKWSDSYYDPPDDECETIISAEVEEVMDLLAEIDAPQTTLNRIVEIVEHFANAPTMAANEAAWKAESNYMASVYAIWIDSGCKCSCGRPIRFDDALEIGVCRNCLQEFSHWPDGI